MTMGLTALAQALANSRVASGAVKSMAISALAIKSENALGADIFSPLSISTEPLSSKPGALAICSMIFKPTLPLAPQTIMEFFLSVMKYNYISFTPPLTNSALQV